MQNLVNDQARYVYKWKKKVKIIGFWNFLYGVD